MKCYLLLLAVAVAAPVFSDQFGLQHVSVDDRMSQPPSKHVFHENEDVEGAAIVDREMEFLLKMLKNLFLDASQPKLPKTKHFRRSILDLKGHSGPLCNYNPDISKVEASYESLPEDCSKVVGYKFTVYKIKPRNAQEPFFVYCDLETQGGGWTVFQRRTDSTIDFYRDWKDYKDGFGNIEGNFWLGLEKIHLLTKDKVYELYIELEDFTPEKRYARYSSFAVGAEAQGYPLSILGKYEGNAGDSFSIHAGQKFSTFDKDQDSLKNKNCANANDHAGGWWYNNCSQSNLNGRYLNGAISKKLLWQGMHWKDFKGYNYSLKSTKMMVRPVGGTDFVSVTTGKPSGWFV